MLSWWERLLQNYAVRSGMTVAEFQSLMQFARAVVKRGK